LFTPQESTQRLGVVLQRQNLSPSLVQQRQARPALHRPNIRQLVPCCVSHPSADAHVTQRRKRRRSASLNGNSAYGNLMRTGYPALGPPAIQRASPQRGSARLSGPHTRRHLPQTGIVPIGCIPFPRARSNNSCLTESDHARSIVAVVVGAAETAPGHFRFTNSTRPAGLGANIRHPGQSHLNRFVDGLGGGVGLGGEFLEGWSPMGGR